MSKTEPRLVPFEDLTWVPRFKYGEMAQLAEVCNADDGSELGAGFGRLTNARIPWTIRYDEVLIVLGGELKLHLGDYVKVLKEKDSIWLPAETELVYEAKSALIAYAIHPADWAARVGFKP